MYEKERKVAKEAARKAGEIILSYREKKNTHRKSGAGSNSYVTDADIAAQRTIVEILSDAFPDDGFLGEEEHLEPADETRVWVIDPLDGTANYVRDYPAFAVSIALKEKEEYIVGVVYNPLTDELFSAAKGEGAWLNDEPISVSDVTEMKDCMLTVYKESEGIIEALRPHIYNVRTTGAAALDAAYIAAGRLDAYVDAHIHTWDIAAATVLIREAGGRADITPKKGRHKVRYLATNGPLHDNIRELLGDTFDG